MAKTSRSKADGRSGKRVSGKRRKGAAAKPVRKAPAKKVAKIPSAKKPAVRAGKPARTKATRVNGARRSEPSIVEAALAAFAHEVRTPLTGILAISSLLATSDLGERERRWVDTIRVGAEHLAALATLFVDAAKGHASGLLVREEFFDLRALAQTSGDSLSGRAAAKGLQARIEIAGDLPVFVTGDPVRLRAALENLIDNAVKFTPSGEVGLKVSAKQGAKGRLVVTFAISDNGIGLSLVEIKRLFRPFSQANVSIASRFGGAGLGLSSVRQLARAMGGDVVATQKDGGGMVFTLTVALAPAQVPAAEGGDDLAASARSLHILSIEDNPFGRVVLNAILTELGHRTEFIGRGELAPQRIVEGQFDAVLMDMVLPGIDGIEAIRQIRALRDPYGQIGIVGVSGRHQDEARARTAGADAFVVKPVSPRALATALAAATRRAEAVT